MTALVAALLVAAALFWFLLWEFPAFRMAIVWAVVAVLAVVAAFVLTGQAIFWYGKRTNRWRHQ